MAAGGPRLLRLPRQSRARTEKCKSVKKVFVDTFLGEFTGKMHNLSASHAILSHGPPPKMSLFRELFLHLPSLFPLDRIGRGRP